MFYFLFPRHCFWYFNQINFMRFWLRDDKALFENTIIFFRYLLIYFIEASALVLCMGCQGVKVGNLNAFFIYNNFRSLFQVLSMFKPSLNPGQCSMDYGQWADHPKSSWRLNSVEFKNVF